MISVVILTLNEADSLQRSLDSVAFSDDILVVDSGSTDGTADIARAAGARVVTRAFDSFAGQRNFAMDTGAFRNPWVLHLDADEVVTPELRDELQALARAGAAAAFPVYRIPSRLIFMGRWLRHAGMYPAYQVRFGRAGELRFVDHGHGQREVQAPGQVGTCAGPFEHYNFSKGINDWFARHLRYARREAAQAVADAGDALPLRALFTGEAMQRRRALKQVGYRLPLRPLLRFLYVYVGKAGFLDGRAGFHYAAMIGVYQYLIDLNELEARGRI
jgi:glycosyltransferase involved in cell wall biosynthesis